jgi:aryl-alcohol dehydrogenase-like predicted oxidoreductase
MHQTEFRPESLNVANELKAYAQSRGLSPTQFAIAWALNNRCLSGVIGGPRTLEQWQDYVLSLNVNITAEDEAMVDSLVPQGYASTHGFVDPQYPIQGRQPRG